MITIKVEEAFAFDLLSIYAVKKDKSNQLIDQSNYENFLNNLEFLLGTDKLQTILNSEEYKKLYLANLKTFDLVDNVKTNPCLGKDVDNANYERFLCKKKLQLTYFSDSYNENKIGYQ